MKDSFYIIHQMATDDDLPVVYGAQVVETLDYFRGD